MLTLPPLSLYIHIPWCVRKCPYCDFNSHETKVIPEQDYVDQLLRDFELDLPFVQGRKLQSIFFGGGTPSLFSAAAIATILRRIETLVSFENDIEITLEANPGTAEAERFHGYRASGANRLSIGVQSFNAHHLTKLGRIHCGEQAEKAVYFAKNAGFERINIDLMHGLPNQTTEDALNDLQKAVMLGVTHVSWYQLTIEPNTVFYRQPPLLPAEDDLWEIQENGSVFLHKHNFEQYEISAFAKDNHQSAHNLNYWQFGDYLGIGAGAYGKITLPEKNRILRYRKTRQSSHYLAHKTKFYAERKYIADADLVGEFFMNALRLSDGVDSRLFAERTGVPLSQVHARLEALIGAGLLKDERQRICATKKGLLFLNDVLAAFV